MTFDPYAILQLDRSATDDDVNAAYRRLSKTLHPDVSGEASAEAFADLTKARDMLLDGDLKRRFDETGMDDIKSMLTVEKLNGIFLNICSELPIDRFDSTDIIAMCRTSIQLQLAHAEGQLAQLRKREKDQRKGYKALKKRMQCSKNNFLLACYEKAMKNILAPMMQCSGEVEILKRTVELLDDFKYDFTQTFTITNCTFTNCTFSNF